MRRDRFYIDASVVGGCLDQEFAEKSLALIDMAREGKVAFVVSDLLINELLDAPPDVRAILASVPDESIERVPMTAETGRLRDAYLAAKVVGRSSSNDAHHVALATVARAQMVVSWNFTHLVHYDKIRGFNAVNLRLGYPLIEIHSPLEVV